MSKVTLGYWKIRGRGQVPRLLLAYTNAIWEDVQYTAPEQWFAADKHLLKLDFPNLPYLIDGDFRITQTAAICTYIIERSSKFELMGRTIKEKAYVLNIVGVIDECIHNLVTLGYSPNFSTSKTEEWKNKIGPKMEYIEKFIAKKDWLLGYLTLADFLLAEVSHYVENIYPENYKKMKFLQLHRATFQSIPEIKQYYEQESGIKGPFLSPKALIKF